MTHKRLQPGPHRPALPSLLGDGLPERLRSTSIALLGIVAALGLGIVAFALQLGFPLIASAPLPQPPARPDAASERKLAEKPARKAATGLSAAPAAPKAGAQADSPPVGTGGSSPAAPAAPEPASDGPVLVTGTAAPRTRPQRERPVDRPSPAESPATVAPSPPPPPPVEPTATSSEAPEPAPEAVPEAPPSTHPGNGNAYGKGNGKGVGSKSGPPGHASHGHGQDGTDE